MRTSLGVAYLGAFLLGAVLPLVAFGATGLFVIVPTALWLASGLRARAPRAGDLTDGVVGWPGLTAAVAGMSSFAATAAGGRGMVAVWLASLATCGVLELVRARIAKMDNLRAESAPHGRRRR